MSIRSDAGLLGNLFSSVLHRENLTLSMIACHANCHAANSQTE
jgi:hypothetical protein